MLLDPSDVFGAPVTCIAATELFDFSAKLFDDAIDALISASLSALFGSTELCSIVGITGVRAPLAIVDFGTGGVVVKAGAIGTVSYLKLCVQSFSAG
jgi:hypothetical protein